MSLRRRLILTLAPLFIGGLIAVDLATYFSLQAFLVGKLDEQVVSVHGFVERAITGEIPPPGRRPPGEPLANFPPGAFGELVTRSGLVLKQRDFPGPGGDDATAGLALPARLRPQSFLTTRGSTPETLFRVYVDATHDGSGNLVLVALPLDDVAATLSQLLGLEVAATAAITVVVLVATWMIVRRGLRPLERMGRTARAAATDLSTRVSPAVDSSEVGRLGLAINDMLGQLESAFAERAASEQRLRHFVSDASHELRTPLTSIGGYAELLRRTPTMTDADVRLATRRIEEEAHRMGILVDDLLLLARLDQGRPLDRAAVDLSALVEDACADARAADPSRTVTAVTMPALRVLGDDLRLRQVLGNLVRNAVVHTPPGTPVEVVATTAGSTALLEVVDHGRGIPSDQAQRIFERFHRSDPDRSRDQGGSGLGLSIAAAVVEAHGGRIALRQTPGGGATFSVALPAADSQATPIRGTPVAEGGAAG